MRHQILKRRSALTFERLCKTNNTTSATEYALAIHVLTQYGWIERGGDVFTSRGTQQPAQWTGPRIWVSNQAKCILESTLNRISKSIFQFSYGLMHYLQHLTLIFSHEVLLLQLLTHAGKFLAKFKNFFNHASIITRRGRYVNVCNMECLYIYRLKCFIYVQFIPISSSMASRRLRDTLALPLEQESPG